MDALARVTRTFLVPSVSKYEFEFPQDHRKCQFFKDISVQEIAKILDSKTGLNVILISNCKLDDAQLSLISCEDLEMLFVTNCVLEYPPWLYDIQTLAYLDLSCNTIVSIPSDIGKLKSLRVLNLCGNRISSLPDEIGRLTYLQILDLSKNSLSHLPKSVCAIKSLLFFNCSANSLVKLPGNISDLINLEVFFLTNNILTNLPKGFALLKRLQRLKLDGNRFEYLPFCVFECTDLKELVFSYNQASGVVPDNFCKLLELEILCLAFNKFTKLPGKLACLSKLKYLNLRGNDIGRISEHFFDNCIRLCVVDLNSCGLLEIPKELGLCQNLCVLDLAHNGINDLPSECSALKTLTNLFLSKNNIRNLPDWVCQLQNLINISLDGNKLIYLPDAFKAVVKNLRVIDISHNFFEVLPTCLFPDCSKLTYLTVNYNPVLKIPTEINRHQVLTHLSISHCPYINELPEEIGELVKLQALRLSSNSLSSLPRGLHKLDCLSYLDLSDNRFSRFPVVVCFMIHLKVLIYNSPCRTCSFGDPDPPGWFDRSDLIDPNASMSKLGKMYIDGEGGFIEDDVRITLDEALNAEEEATNIPNLPLEEISQLVYKRKAPQIPRLLSKLRFLVHLSLQRIGLFYLPNIFHKLKHLQRLYLNDNNLRKIPSSIASCSSLTHIDLRNNKISELGNDLRKLPQLRYLHLGDNSFPECLREIIGNSSIQGLFKYLEAESRHSRFILRRMCEVFGSRVRADNWALILERLGVSEDTIQHIEDELPGGYNHSRRVRRSLEYWTGLDLSSQLDSQGVAINTGTTTGTDLLEPLTSTMTANSFSDVDEPTPTVTIDHPTAESDAAALTMLQPITLRFVPSVVGPKASPERFVHVLRLLNHTELADAVEEVVIDSHMQHV